ncbi:MAG TPA: SgcJ/EcaC family oxidoreductase [Porticoccaceae bacterium]
MTDFLQVESGIRQLHARFIDAVWRKDADAFASCFAADGEWKIAGMHMRSREEIGNTFAMLLGVCARVVILPGIPLLNVTEDEVSARVTVTELAKMVDGTSAMTVGVYYDRYVQEQGEWRFQWRHFGLHYRGPIDMSAELVECPDYGPPPGMPGQDEPTFTRRKPQA